MMGIETKGLVKHYGKIMAVNQLDLQVRAGSLYALLGVNGAGKTTSMRMLCGLTTPDAGDACIMGISVREKPAEVRRIVGLSPQESAVAPKLTVAENLEMIAEIYGANRRQTHVLHLPFMYTRPILCSVPHFRRIGNQRIKLSLLTSYRSSG